MQQCMSEALIHFRSSTWLDYIKGHLPWSLNPWPSYCSPKLFSPTSQHSALQSGQNATSVAVLVYSVMCHAFLYAHIVGNPNLIQIPLPVTYYLLTASDLVASNLIA